MDLKDLDTVQACNDGAELDVVSPEDGSELGIRIRLAGPDSDVYTKAVRKQSDRRLKTLQRQNKQRLTTAELEQEGIELLADCTLAWEGIEYNGEKVEGSKDNAVWLYKTFPWIKEQVDEFVGERANFIEA